VALDFARPWWHPVKAVPVVVRQHAVLIAASFLLVTYLAVFYVSRNSVFGDEEHYLRLANSLIQGKFSGEKIGDVQLTDKLRNPGYPAFLALFKMIGVGLMGVKVVQLLLTLASVAILTRLLKSLAVANRLPTRSATVVFLMVSALNVQFAYYAANISSESTMILAVSVFLSCLYQEPSNRAGAGAGLAAGMGFMLRPTILYLPFLIALVRIRDRRWRIPMVVLVAVYSLFLAGSGWFNLRHNGVFAIGPLEGTSYFSNLGFWQHKMPDVRLRRHYDGIVMGHEHMERPTPDEIATAVMRFESDWDAVDAITHTTLTDEDRAYILRRGGDVKHPSRWGANYGFAYHRARGKALGRITLEHVLDEPFYYLRTRLYNGLRLFFPNIDPTKWKEMGMVGRVQALWATLSGFITFICGLAMVGVMLYRRQLDRASASLACGVIFYFWAVHIPMNLAARYTIPIQLPAIVLVSLALTRLWNPDTQTRKSGRPAVAPAHA
jgi:hypothetical protein